MPRPFEDGFVGGHGASSTGALGKTEKIYAKAGVLGSPEKDVRGESRAKEAGVEMDASEEARRLGLVTVASPSTKRLAVYRLLLFRLCRIPSWHACWEVGLRL